MSHYTVIATKQYKKDYKRLLKAGFNIEKLEEIIDRLATNETLDQRHHDHALKGIMQNTRECHIGPDWLLRYAKNGKDLILFLISTGSHRHVLGIE